MVIKRISMRSRLSAAASVKIGDERVYASTLTSAEQAVVVEWAVRRRAELRQAWDAVQEGRVPGQIAP
jgi:hypothetical protein